MQTSIDSMGTLDSSQFFKKGLFSVIYPSVVRGHCELARLEGSFS
jgi:hypothetical protein